MHVYLVICSISSDRYRCIRAVAFFSDVIEAIVFGLSNIERYRCIRASGGYLYQRCLSLLSREGCAHSDRYRCKWALEFVSDGYRCMHADIVRQ